MKRTKSQVSRLKKSDFSVKRDVLRSRKEPLPLSDLSGKGIIAGINNRSKMNYQNN